MMLIATALVIMSACDNEPEAESGESTESGDPGPTAEACLAEPDVTSCEALGCRWHDTLAIDANACTTSAGSGRCFALEGQPVGQASEPHAYYRTEVGQLEFMIYPYDCATPQGWTECATEGDVPPECACLCAMTVSGDPVLCGDSPLCD
ncbi:hypothetical protein DB30_02689 [Enhygromyxa salina]|uniref:Uncharacterized protein n=2 Tax=Enhygromyxa salina TaxID=215803 RepID=A0A0C2A7D4_9BACT|nr:hypothetical protein DB30_02689 [Enhygromyxa salina]